MPPKTEVTTEAEAIAAIEAAGYTSVSYVEQHGATWHANALNACGEPVKVLIDGAGRVKEQGSSDQPEVQPTE